jgi:hypothetical protein
MLAPALSSSWSLLSVPPEEMRITLYSPTSAKLP